MCSGMLVPQLRQRSCSVLYCSTHSRAAGAKVAKNVMKKLNQASCDGSVQVSIGVRHKLRSAANCRLVQGAENNLHGMPACGAWPAKTTVQRG